jgi:CubicO group peptidase (beta-lactamase class C family)
MSDQGVPGLSVAVAANGTIWAKGYGLSDLENFVPAKAFTAYRIASVAKPVTAVAAVQLAERGQLDLDAAISNYLPDFPVKRWTFSMRHLLTHTAGIRWYKDGVEASLAQHYPSLELALELFKADPLKFEPGTAYLYSTYGYVLAGRVLEVVSGRPYFDLIEEQILRRAGMRSTRIDSVAALIPNRARGYRKTPTGETVNSALHDTSYKIPGGGLISTGPDLVRFAMALHKGTLLQPDSLKEMWTPYVKADGRSTGYGLGWSISAQTWARKMQHSGGQAGVSTLLVYLPEYAAAAAVLCNLEGAKLEALADAVLQIAVGRGSREDNLAPTALVR